MSNEQATPPPAPVVTGVAHGQTAPTEVVSELPANLKQAGEIAQFPATAAIDTLRRDGGGSIKGESSWVLLHHMVQGLEHRAIAAEAENKLLRASESDLKTRNAVLEKENSQKDDDRKVRSGLVVIGTAMFGLAGQFAVGNPTAGNVLATIAGAAVLLIGLSYPLRS